MNIRESIVADEYENDGWTVLRNGAPDFLMLRINGDISTGKIEEIEAVEVKKPGEKLKPEQLMWKRVLEHLGVKFKVVEQELLKDVALDETFEEYREKLKAEGVFTNDRVQENGMRSPEDQVWIDNTLTIKLARMGQGLKSKGYNASQPRG